MDSGPSYLDALLMMVFAHVALLLVAGIFMLSSYLMHRGMSFKEGHAELLDMGWLKVWRRFKRGAGKIAKDDKMNVVLAAAVAGYLQAEQERKV